MATLKLADEELGDFGFFDEDDAAKQLRPYVWRRVKAAIEGLQSDRTTFLQNGLYTNNHWASIDDEWH